MAILTRACTLAALLTSWAAAHAAGRPWSTSSTSTTRVLSEEPRIEYRSDFLDDAQVAGLRRLADGIGFEAVDEATQETSGGEEVCILNRSLTHEHGTEEEWDAVGALEAAASAWAKLPVGGAAPVVTRWEPWAPGTHLNRSGLLHLDARQRPRHHRTVLVYLSGGDGGVEGTRRPAGAAGPGGGLTVFPCVETDDMDAKEAARRRKMCSRAHRHVALAHDKLRTLREKGLALPPDQQFEFLEAHPELFSLPKEEADGTQPINWQWTPAHDEVRAEPGTPKADPLAALAEAMCRGEASGLRVAPARGAALLVEAAVADSKGNLRPDWNLWHAGCSPAESSGGGRRWTLQLFLDGDGSALKGKKKKKKKSASAAGTCSPQDGGESEACTAAAGSGATGRGSN